MTKQTSYNKKRRKKKTVQRKGTGPLLVIVAVLCAAMLLAAYLSENHEGSAGTVGDRLRISEVMTSNATLPVTETGDVSDWIEIENVSDAAVNLKGWTLMNLSKPSRSFVFPSGTLQPGEYAVVCADNGNQALKDGVYHAPFKLSAAGESIALLDRDGRRADTVDVPSLQRDQVYCLDLSDAWQLSYAATPGESNLTEVPAFAQTASAQIRGGDLEITEAMSDNATYFPDEDGEHPDYVEIHNASDRPVNLSGWYLTNDGDKLRRWPLPDTTLDADGHLAIHCSGKNRTDDPAHLHTDFCLSGGGSVYLVQSDGSVAAHVLLPELEADQAYSLQNGVWSAAFAPSPGAANTVDGADRAAQDIAARNAFGVYITEIAASTDAETGDWIELCNRSAQPVDLSGFGLSNNAGRPRKWQFPSGTTIQPGESLVVRATGADDQLQTNFRLGADGGYSVTLADAGGTIFDRVFVTQQYRGISYGRAGDSDGLRYFEQPTPGAANAGPTYVGRAPTPTYSVPGGLYRTGDVLTVELGAPSDCRVYYTLDNTDPTESSTLYTGPISISGQTILRTRAYRDGCMPSFMDAQSYLFDAKNGGGSVYVVSVVSDPRNLTSAEEGILVRGSGSRPNYMMDWEREIHVEIFDREGQPLLSQECCMRQQGQTCRDQPQQCFKLIARGEYGDSLFRGRIFSKRDYADCRAFLLRNSSDDASKTRMRDSVLTTLAEDTSVLYQETEVCVVYLNGEYWGHYNIREGIDTHSICQHEGWEGDDHRIDLIKGNDIVLQGSDSTFVALVNALKSKGSNSDEAYQAIDSVVDIQNYIEYMAIEIFSGNTDPSNVKRYRNANADGKWRWVLYDIDWAFNQDTNSIARWLNPGGVGNGGRTDNTFFILCMKNDTFRDQFLTHLGQELATTFSKDSVLERFQTRYELLTTILPDHFERWNESEATYNKELKRLISFASARPKRMLQFLKYSDKLKLSQAEMETYFGDAMARAGLTYNQIAKP